MQVLYERCAAVDVGKDVIAVAVRLPGDGPDGRQTVKRTFKTFYGVLGEAARWLTSLGVTHVAMEATCRRGVAGASAGLRAAEGELHPARRHQGRRDVIRYRTLCRRRHRSSYAEARIMPMQEQWKAENGWQGLDDAEIGRRITAQLRQEENAKGADTPSASRTGSCARTRRWSLPGGTRRTPTSGAKSAPVTWTPRPTRKSAPIQPA
jgi:hypothetical protein